MEYTSEHGWPCACPRKLPVDPMLWERTQRCPHCSNPLKHPDYEAPQTLVPQSTTSGTS